MVERLSTSSRLIGFDFGHLMENFRVCFSLQIFHC